MKRAQDDLRELVRRLKALQERARRLGLFAGDRELLECPKCGLLEDVTCTGELITCHRPTPGQDAGLRFEELSPGRFRCPACGSLVDES